MPIFAPDFLSSNMMTVKQSRGLSWILPSRRELGSRACLQVFEAGQPCFEPQSSEYSEWQRDGVRSGHRKAIWLSGEDRTYRYIQIYTDIDQTVHLKFHYCVLELLLPTSWILWCRFWRPNCQDSSEVFTWEFVGIEGPSKDRSSFHKLSVFFYIFFSSGSCHWSLFDQATSTGFTMFLMHAFAQVSWPSDPVAQ